MVGMIYRKGFYIMKRFLLFLRKYPILTAVLAVLFSVVSIRTLRTESMWQVFVLRMLLCASMSFMLYLISDDRTLARYGDNTGRAIRTGIGFIVFALLVGIFGVLISVEKTPVDSIPVAFLTLFLAMMSVGLFEEITFRAIINDAVMRVFKNSRGVYVLSALCSSLVFGGAHVIGAELTSALMWLQAVLKTVSAGLFGLALLFIYWKYRNIWACGIIHGLYDFCLSLSECFFVPGERASYVMEGQAGIATCWTYSILSVISLVFLWFVWRKTLKGMDMKELRENW